VYRAASASVTYRKRGFSAGRGSRILQRQQQLERFVLGFAEIRTGAIRQHDDRHPLGRSHPDRRAVAHPRTAVPFHPHPAELADEQPVAVAAVRRRNARVRRGGPPPAESRCGMSFSD
jgi:hypothetical protein